MSFVWMIPICAATLLLGCLESRAQPLQLELERPPEGNAVDVRLKGKIQSPKPLELRLQRSSDLSTWSPHGQKLRLPVGVNAIDTTLAQDPSGQGFFRLSTRETSFTSSEGSEILGYQSSFDDELEALGPFSIADFTARFGSQPAYLPGISWDPTNSLYWDAFQRDIVKPYSSEIVPGLKLSEAELAVFRTNGFVVSERLSDRSFGDIYYNIFIRDLPVFITTDSILHAWHRSFSGVLEVIEEGHLRGTLRNLLLGMLRQVEGARSDYGSGPLAVSLEDSEYFLTVAARLCSLPTEPLPSDSGAIPASDPARAQRLKQRVDEVLACIASPPAIPVSYSFFDANQGDEVVDFSHFLPRGHYVQFPALQRYFQAMMWLGRVDLRVAGDSRWASRRQLGTAIVLNDLLNRSGMRGEWQKLDRFITAFFGPADSMNFTQLDGLLRGAGLADPKSIASMAPLESFQSRIEAGTLAVQLIQSHGFVAGAGDDQIKLPRSFTFLGQRFTVDGWAFNQVVMDRILQYPPSNPPQFVRRRLPYSLDAAFAVLGNDQIVPELAANMTRSDGVSFRDGFPYQRNLAAVRLALDARPADFWNGTLYDHWLFVLRTLSVPTVGPEYPEAMRTRAWALKTVNTQMASWTQLRHDSLLYVKPPETPTILCDYPHGFVEPRPVFFQAMKRMATGAADTLKSMALPPVGWLQRGAIELPNPEGFFRAFADTCTLLETIAQRELDQQPLLESQVSFLRNTIEKIPDYFGIRRYKGWYPSLFFWGQNGNGVPCPLYFDGFNNPNLPPFRPGSSRADHDCVFPDFSVSDVHTDGPSAPDGDPGAVLHQGVGRVNLMMIAVDNGPDRMVFAGPVFSHYEFTAPLSTRLTDEAWTQSVDAGTTPAPPPWTRSYLVRKP